MAATVEKKALRMTMAEWEAQGTALFGPNKFDWVFVCPICGGTQKVDDFKKYKEVGATPASAYQQCIGRFLKPSEREMAFGGGKPTPETRCDYALYGLIQIPGVIVSHEDGTESMAFAFALDYDQEVPT